MLRGIRKNFVLNFQNILLQFRLLLHEKKRVNCLIFRTLHKIAVHLSNNWTYEKKKFSSYSIFRLPL